MDKNIFNKTEKYYHYTTFESAIKILESQKLLFSKFERLNDINESYRPIFCNNKKDRNGFNSIIAQYRQISLTIDLQYHRGFGIPAMWGHYADDGNGACIVIDKNKLCTHITDNNYSSGNVEYNNDYDNSIVIGDEPIKDFLQKYEHELFFKKSYDWSYEQEFRIISKYANESISLKGCLIAIIIYTAIDIQQNDSIWNSLNYGILHKIEPSLPILEFSRWFGKQQLIDSNSNDWVGNCFE